MMKYSKGPVELGKGIPARIQKKLGPKSNSAVATDAACHRAGNECLHLDVDELRSRPIAAQNVRVWCVPHRDHGSVAATTKLSCNEELAGVPPVRLIVLGAHYG
jgi:hypothetical protein